MDHDKSNSKSKEHGFSTCVVPPYKNIYGGLISRFGSRGISS